MTKSSKSNFQKALKTITSVVETQLSKFPSELADAKREKINQIASSAASRSRGKSLKLSRTRASRLSTRSRA
jgi:hypothetical protein